MREMLFMLCLFTFDFLFHPQLLFTVGGNYDHVVDVGLQRVGIFQSWRSKTL